MRARRWGVVNALEEPPGPLVGAGEGGQIHLVEGIAHLVPVRATHEVTLSGPRVEDDTLEASSDDVPGVGVRPARVLGPEEV